MVITPLSKKRFDRMQLNVFNKEKKLFPEYWDTRIQLYRNSKNALLAGHDFIFLGERGQAKTRMIRGLTDLLDEWMPIIAGSEINDDPIIQYQNTLLTLSTKKTQHLSNGCTEAKGLERNSQLPILQ
ncbi:MAG: hypothetical protein CM15mP49_21200 [Actinomycetota bacterium]|nr:MAG: hypothetical protein CM15mP49_21200 [Actinomycetota bacterium]